MNDGSVYDEDYFMRGIETKKSLYVQYSWKPELTVPMVCSMVRHLGIGPDDSILDFGCARGYTVRAFREMAYDAWGYDISQWALENADEAVKEFLICNQSTILADSFDWVIAKDVLEHIGIGELGVAIDLMKCAARKGLFVVVPLASNTVFRYDVPEYELDVTHIHRMSLNWWVGKFFQTGWSVEARYRVNGIKDNYSQYPTGNGFIVARKLV